MSLLKDLKISGSISYNEPLCDHTSFKIGSQVKVWAEPLDSSDLSTLLEIAKAEGLPVFLIGGGTNLLVSDEGRLDMMAISLKKNFQAGLNLQGFILKNLQEGWSGLEFMAGIPGSIGGAIRMNAGGGINGPWVSDFIEGVKVMDCDGQVRHVEKKDLKFNYRESNLKEVIILDAEFNLKRASNKESSLKEYKKVLAEKKNKQELSMPSAGCVFKNPQGLELSAGKLIEDCGLKGKRIGDAMVSPKHANFIVSLGKARFKDVTGLIRLIKEMVLEKYGVTLELEIEIIK